MDLSSLGDLPFQTVTAAMAYRLLGPTAAYLGGKSKELTEKMVINIETIFNVAYRKCGSHLDMPGCVPPRVLRGIVSEGAFCEDQIAAEYLGGILASSRVEGGNRDDRGVVMNAMVARLSIYQLRTHYLIYAAYKELYEGVRINLNQDDNQYTLAMPFLTYLLAMGFHENELRSDSRRIGVKAIVDHTFYGLKREELIQDFFVSAQREPVTYEVIPSVGGVELFLWAHGLGDMTFSDFLSSNTVCSPIEGLDVPLEPAETYMIGGGEPPFPNVPPFTYRHPQSVSCRLPQDPPVEDSD